MAVGFNGVHGFRLVEGRNSFWGSLRDTLTWNLERESKRRFLYKRRFFGGSMLIRRGVPLACFLVCESEACET